MAPLGIFAVVGTPVVMLSEAPAAEKPETISGPCATE